MQTVLAPVSAVPGLQSVKKVKAFADLALPVSAAGGDDSSEEDEEEDGDGDSDRPVPLKNLDDVVSRIKGFLMSTAAAYRVVSQGEDADDDALRSAYTTIVTLSENVPAFVKSFKTVIAPKLEALFLPYLVKSWVRDLEEISRDAAHLPKNVLTDAAVAELWLGKITKPLRKMLREIEDAAKKERHRKLSEPTKHEQRREKTQKSTGPVRLPPMQFRQQLKDVIKERFPEIADRFGVDVDKDDPKVKQWVSEQMSGYRPMHDTSRLTPKDMESGLIADVGVLVSMSASISAQTAMKAAGYKTSWVMGWANIHNAYVYMAAPGKEAVRAAQLFVAGERKNNPDSPVTQLKLWPVPLAFKYKGHSYCLLLPAKAASEVDVTDWRFAL